MSCQPTGDRIQKNRICYDFNSCKRPKLLRICRFLSYFSLLALLQVNGLVVALKKPRGEAEISDAPMSCRAGPGIHEFGVINCG